MIPSRDVCSRKVGERGCTSCLSLIDHATLLGVVQRVQ